MKTLITFLLVLVPALAQAQTDPCQTAVQPFTVTSGAPFTVTWLQETTVAASSSDPTLVPARIDGFYFQIDSATRTRITVTPSAVCAAGTVNAGRTPYIYRTTNGVVRGAHTLRLTAFNFVLDANGNPTATEQESAAVSIPFSAVDLGQIQFGPPQPPINVIIRR